LKEGKVAGRVVLDFVDAAPKAKAATEAREPIPA